MRYEFFRALSALRFKSALSAYEPTMVDRVTFQIYKVCDEIGSKFCKGELLITTVRRAANVKRFEEEMRANWGHYYH